MGISSETKFVMINFDDAFTNVQQNLIRFGRKYCTLETFIHEINELEVSVLLNKIGEIERNAKINEWSKIKYKECNLNTDGSVTHILSPYGHFSLIDGYTNIIGQIETEDDLLESDIHSILNEGLTVKPKTEYKQGECIKE